MSRVSKILWALSIPFLLPSPGQAADDTSFDQQLSAKYGLDIPPAANEVRPAPQWVRQAEIVASSAAVWKGYEFLLKEAPVTRIVRSRSGHRRMQLVEYHPLEKVTGIDAESVRGVPLLSHVPHRADTFRLAHEHGNLERREGEGQGQ